MVALPWAPCRVIRDEEEYDAVIAEIYRLLDLDAPVGSEDDEKLDFLSVLAQTYEERHYPVEPVSAQSMVDFMLEQRGMTRADLEKYLGGERGVSEFFDGTLKLSREQIEAMRDLLGIPVEQFF